jgi:hypothetical protein
LRERWPERSEGQRGVFLISLPSWERWPERSEGQRGGSSPALPPPTIVQWVLDLGRILKGKQNQLKDVAHAVGDVVAGDAQYKPTLFKKPAVSPPIPLQVIVRVSVDFDDYPLREANEIRNEPSDGDLPSEFHAKSPGPNLVPQKPFTNGRIRTHPFRVPTKYLSISFHHAPVISDPTPPWNHPATSF